TVLGAPLRDELEPPRGECRWSRRLRRAGERRDLVDARLGLGVYHEVARVDQLEATPRELLEQRAQRDELDVRGVAEPQPAPLVAGQRGLLAGAAATVGRRLGLDARPFLLGS